MANVQEWPNGIGWDVGRAEIRDRVTHLRVFVPIASERGRWSNKLRQYVQLERHKVCDVPLGTNPLRAVELCRAFGIARYDDAYNPPSVIPMINADLQLPTA